MPDAVTDTHALIWYLQDDTKLSLTAGKYFDNCTVDGGHIYVPSISVVEIIYLSEKGRIPTETLHSLLQDLSAPDTIFDVVGLTLAIAREISNVSRSAVPDMPDRIIAATALSLRLPLLSRDHKIQLSSVTTIW